MKRIALFTLYDQDGIIDRSEEYLLRSLSAMADKLVVIVNGTINVSAMPLLRETAGEIIIRENKGYDGGAYKEVLLGYLADDRLSAYDELILVNDTFYGPFYPWIEVCEQMEMRHPDFWGLTKWERQYSGSFKKILPEHVQSYFLAFSKKVFADAAFLNFWKSMPEINSHDDAIAHFEVALTEQLTHAGFSHLVYKDLFPDIYYDGDGGVAFSSRCYDLLKDCRFPILKKKNGFSLTNPQSLPAIQYIDTHYSYDVGMIWENALRTLENGKLFLKVAGFCEGYKKIYVYGTGKYCAGVEEFLKYKGWSIDGYLETKPGKNERDGKPVIAWKDFEMDKDTGIIVALGKKNTEEVKEFLPQTDAFLFLS